MYYLRHIRNAIQAKINKLWWYKSYNTTAVQYMLAEIHEARLDNNMELYEDELYEFCAFADWRATQPACYIPDTGLEAMYSNKYFEELRKFFIDERPKEQFVEFINELKRTYGRPHMRGAPCNYC